MRSSTSLAKIFLALCAATLAAGQTVVSVDFNDKIYVSKTTTTLQARGLVIAFFACCDVDPAELLFSCFLQTDTFTHAHKCIHTYTRFHMQVVSNPILDRVFLNAPSGKPLENPIHDNAFASLASLNVCLDVCVCVYV